MTRRLLWKSLEFVNLGHTCFKQSIRCSFTYVMFPSDWDHPALPEIGYEVNKYLLTPAHTRLGKAIVCNSQVKLKYMPESRNWFC